MASHLMKHISLTVNGCCPQVGSTEIEPDAVFGHTAA